MAENQDLKLPNIDVNGTEFYDKVQDEIEFDVARLKKTVEVMKNLRLTAAEIEVETAALYHAEFFQMIEELKCLTDTCTDTLVDLEEPIECDVESPIAENSKDD